MNELPQPKTYTAKKLTQPITINSDWNKAAWGEVKSLQLLEYMGPEPAHKPKVQAKIAYDEEALYLIYQVEDRYVRSVRTQYQDPVYRDSAVEFFFCPSDDFTQGYFNLEVNCGGTALFRFRSKETGTLPIPESVFNQIEISSSCPKIIDPEIESEMTWTLEIRIPVEILRQYYPITPPAPGEKWKVNLYKIADDSSHPHYLTWSKVIYPNPNFHLPEFFGILVFE